MPLVQEHLPDYPASCDRATLREKLTINIKNIRTCSHVVCKSQCRSHVQPHSTVSARRVAPVEKFNWPTNAFWITCCRRSGFTWLVQARHSVPLKILKGSTWFCELDMGKRSLATMSRASIDSAECGNTITTSWARWLQSKDPTWFYVILGKSHWLHQCWKAHKETNCCRTRPHM